MTQRVTSICLGGDVGTVGCRGQQLPARPPSDPHDLIGR